MSHGNYYSKQPKKYCPVKCNTDVALELDARPKVSCREICRQNTEFDIELDFEVNPRCILVPKKTHKDACGCVTRCEYTVKLDFDCVPKVKCLPCQKPSARYNLDIEVDVEPRCLDIEKHESKKSVEKKSAEKKSAEKKYSNDCDCDVCKSKQKSSSSSSSSSSSFSDKKNKKYWY